MYVRESVCVCVCVCVCEIGREGGRKRERVSVIEKKIQSVSKCTNDRMKGSRNEQNKT